MDAFVLQAEHDVQKQCRGYLRADTVRSDVCILAEYAAQIAAREKDRTRAVLSADGRFFPVMGCGSCDAKAVALSAESDCSAAVDAALARTVFA